MTPTDPRLRLIGCRGSHSEPDTSTASARVTDKVPQFRQKIRFHQAFSALVRNIK